MKTKLYVYTGTGNSLWIARQLALELKGATLESMPCLSADFMVEADRVGIIFPVHIWGLRRQLEETRRIYTPLQYQVGYISFKFEGLVGKGRRSSRSL
jgi:hypothetical protein